MTRTGSIQSATAGSRRKKKIHTQLKLKKKKRFRGQPVDDQCELRSVFRTERGVCCPLREGILVVLPLFGRIVSGTTLFPPCASLVFGPMPIVNPVSRPPDRWMIIPTLLGRDSRIFSGKHCSLMLMWLFITSPHYTYIHQFHINLSFILFIVVMVIYILIRVCTTNYNY